MFPKVANQVVGIARDGHLLYGPYNSDLELWHCDDHDVCNGMFMQDGSYSYVSTVTHPYSIGCWGPATVQYVPHSLCSLNTCGGITLIVANAMAIVLSLSLF